jgi:hypothetical protein
MFSVTRETSLQIYSDEVKKAQSIFCKMDCPQAIPYGISWKESFSSFPGHDKQSWKENQLHAGCPEVATGE